MTDIRVSKQRETDKRESSEALYHEAQADGVPYDEDLDASSRDLPEVATAKR